MKKVVSHPLVVLVITLILGLFWWSLYRTILSFGSSQHYLAELHEEVNHQASQVEKLKQQLQEAQDPLTKEKIARNELLQQKPGEYVIKIDEDATPAINQPQEEIKTPWQQWRELLFE